MSPEVLEALGKLLWPLLTAAATYGGIRADLRGLHERVKRLEDVRDAKLLARRA